MGQKKIIFIGFLVLTVLVLGRISLAETPGIKITEPLDGTTVTPGQDITVTVEAIGGFEIKDVLVVAPFSVDTLTSSPFTIVLTIPYETLGTISISASGKSLSGEFVRDEITLIVQQTATLQSLEIDQDKIYVELDWDGNIKEWRSGSIVTTYGLFSDGIKREIPRGELTYTSSNPLVISIDNKGNYEVHRTEEASITVSYSGISKVIPVVFEPPRGIRPSETIPPTTSIDIQPLPNPAGWNNADITITITAQDNEGGSGIAEINYQWYNMSAELEYVQSDTAVLYLSKEGRNHLMYFAVDKERNEEKERHDIEFKLDKTPPTISLELKPINLSNKEKNKGKDEDEGNWYELLYSAADSLSGLKSLNAGLIIPSLTDYKIELDQDNELNITIDEEEKELEIESPNPQQILTQLQSGLLTLNNDQTLQLKIKQGEPKWKIKEKANKGLEIQAPSIIFKAKAEDIADNVAVEELEFKKTRR